MTGGRVREFLTFKGLLSQAIFLKQGESYTFGEMRTKVFALSISLKAQKRLQS
jgi:hypothetical protein